MISGLHNIYLGSPLFDANFFNMFKNLRNINNRERINLLKALSVKTGLKLFLKLGVGIGIKVAIKLSFEVLIVFLAIGTAVMEL